MIGVVIQDRGAIVMAVAARAVAENYPLQIAVIEVGGIASLVTDVVLMRKRNKAARFARSKSKKWSLRFCLLAM
jgi:hypothetical protein